MCFQKQYLSKIWRFNPQFKTYKNLFMYHKYASCTIQEKLRNKWIKDSINTGFLYEFHRQWKIVPPLDPTLVLMLVFLESWVEDQVEQGSRLRGCVLKIRTWLDPEGTLALVHFGFVGQHQFLNLNACSYRKPITSVCSLGCSPGIDTPTFGLFSKTLAPVFDLSLQRITVFSSWIRS